MAPPERTGRQPALRAEWPRQTESLPPARLPALQEWLPEARAKGAARHHPPNAIMSTLPDQNRLLSRNRENLGICAWQTKFVRDPIAFGFKGRLQDMADIA